MKTIIAGSRSISGYKHVDAAMDAAGWKGDTTVVISGHAKGVDRSAEKWADQRGIQKAVFEVTDAMWKKHGKKAGHVRNSRMGEYGDRLLAIWDGESSGTKGMINDMHNRGKPVFVFYPETGECRSNFGD